jgi:hypothetical protein
MHLPSIVSISRLFLATFVHDNLIHHGPFLLSIFELWQHGNLAIVFCVSFVLWKYHFFCIGARVEKEVVVDLSYYAYYA